MIKFQQNDVSLESQWRAIILFGKNTATYKFAFAKSLLEIIEKEKTRISLTDLSVPFANNIIEHLKISDKQGSSASSSLLNACRSHLSGDISIQKVYEITEKIGFKDVVDAFQNVNGDIIPSIFYEKDYQRGKKEIIITDNLLELKNSFHMKNFEQEVEARWNLVETAWNLKINPNTLEVKYDEESSMFFIEKSDFMRRKDITSVRDALNGYQKGKCFYSFQDISIVKNDPKVCQVDHFLPHINKRVHTQNGTNINGVWNLVLAHPDVNGEKGARIPESKYLDRLNNRNEFYIESKHPLAETIINQTGQTPDKRRRFLEEQYKLALEHSIHKWQPKNELIGNF